jgi:hypothetical protein
MDFYATFINNRALRKLSTSITSNGTITSLTMTSILRELFPLDPSLTFSVRTDENVWRDGAFLAAV